MLVAFIASTTSESLVLTLLSRGSVETVGSLSPMPSAGDGLQRPKRPALSQKTAQQANLQTPHLFSAQGMGVWQRAIAMQDEERQQAGKVPGHAQQPAALISFQVSLA